MKITLLCSDPTHPIRAELAGWMHRHPEFEVDLVERKAAAGGGDFLFLISCHEIVDAEVRSRYRHSLVIHASDLPADRGWSPHIWAVLRGDRELTVSLLEVADVVDSGRIWRKEKIALSGNEVAHEINDRLFAAELTLIEWAIANHETVVPAEQDSRRATHLRRRTPEDSRLDPERTLAEQFDLLRIADPERYPAFFEWRGRRFRLRLEPDGEEAPR